MTIRAAAFVAALVLAAWPLTAQQPAAAPGWMVELAGSGMGGLTSLPDGVRVPASLWGGRLEVAVHATGPGLALAVAREWTRRSGEVTEPCEAPDPCPSREVAETAGAWLLRLDRRYARLTAQLGAGVADGADEPGARRDWFLLGGVRVPVAGPTLSVGASLRLHAVEGVHGTAWRPELGLGVRWAPVRMGPGPSPVGANQSRARHVQ